MPLVKRGNIYWIIENVDGTRIRRSLRTSDPAAAKEAYAIELQKAWETSRYGAERTLTFADAVLHYDAKPADAAFLLRIMPHLQNTRIADIKPGTVRDLARKLYPTAATDTWRRQVIVPIRAVINNAADRGLCDPIRIRAFTEKERIEQDRRRGKESRKERKASTAEWVVAFRAACTLPHLSAMVGLMFVTGARIGQALELTAADLNAGRVKIPAAKGRGAEWVDLPDWLYGEMQALKPRHGRLFGYKHRSAVVSAWNSTIKRAGIERLTPHEAGRHGFGTALLRAGVDASTAADLGRWASPKLYLETYAHADKKVRAMDIVTLPIGTNLTQSKSNDE